jgi:DNA-binding transcriptional regulator GbsR (MarR family)
VEVSVTEPTARDERAVAEFVERFGPILEEVGFPRMSARVFVALLASENGRLTAAELAERLQASPAAISGAVRFLVQIDLATRRREPGSRRDYYSVDDDVWYEVIDRRLMAITRWGDHLAEGIAAVGKDTAAGARLADMVAFFDFMRAEMPTFLRRWHEQRGRN